MLSIASACVLAGWMAATGCTTTPAAPVPEARPPQELMAQWESAAPVCRAEIRKALGDRIDVVEPWLLEALNTGTINQRLLACAVLERIASPAAEAALLQACADSDSRVQAQAIQSLSRFGSPAAAEAIRNRLSASSDARVVKAALSALGHLGDPADVPLLASRLSDPDESVQVNAAAALALLGDSSGTSILLAATESGDPQARREATYALGFLNAPEAAERLLAIVSDPLGRWRTEAEMAIEWRNLRATARPDEKAARLQALAASDNDELAAWARARLDDLGLPAAKHATEVHGRGVLGDPNRSLTANAFALLDSNFYMPSNEDDTARGAVDEDIGARPINHFYNPVTGVNTMPTSRMAAVERSEDFWNRALERWRRGQRRGRMGAFHMLGRSMHLLQDMTSPAHVHDDPHVPPLDPDDFEVWGETRYPPPEVVLRNLDVYAPEGTLRLPDGRTVPAGSPAGFVHDMALFTYRLTAIPGEIVADRAMPETELGRMFPEGRLYYQDAGILGANYWQIEDVGRYGLLEENGWWPCDGDFIDEDPGLGAAQRISGFFYIENMSGDHGDLVPAAFERPLRHLKDPEGLTLLEIYTVELYRESVSRCAAFLNAFEKAVESPAPSPTGGCANPAPSGPASYAGDAGATVLAIALLLLAGRRRQ